MKFMLRKIGARGICLFFLSLVILTIYLYFSSWLNGGLFKTSSFARYNLLLDAFFHHRTNVYSKLTFDLSFFKNRFYLYWGPSPVIFILPFYIFGGIYTSDVFYNLVCGLLNILIFYLIIVEAIKYFKLSKNVRLIFVAVLSFALASNNFSLAIFNPGIWQTNQIISIFYLETFYLFLFKFLNQPKKNLYLVWSLVFFNLAWFARISLIINGLFLTYPLYLFYKGRNWDKVKRFLILTSFFCIITLGLDLIYNYGRFGNVFESGLKYQLANPQYIEALRTGTGLNPAHISENLQSYFLNLPHINLSPFKITFSNYEGTSVLLTYPFLLLLLFIPFKGIPKGLRFFIGLSTLVAILNIAILLLYFPNPGIKANNRYFLDITPLLFLIVVLSLDDIPLFIQYFILFWGILINLLTLFFT